jgi:3-oxoacyl-[acyl-carrier protein] reductase
MPNASRVALITGGAKGIGRGIGLELAAQGWAVAFCYRTSGDSAGETAAAIRTKGATALAIPADVSRPGDCERLVATVAEELGGIDALINCAGPYRRVSLLDETVAGWQEMFDNNLHPVFYLARLVAPRMIERKWGRIISFSMANADQGVAQPQITAHYIAKSGILILSRTLARLLAPHNITVNVISPGFVSSGSAPEEELQKMLKNIPAGYIGQVDDAVSVVKFLLSDEARYVNGANVHLSGGWGL